MGFYRFPVWRDAVVLNGTRYMPVGDGVFEINNAADAAAALQRGALQDFGDAPLAQWSDSTGSALVRPDGTVQSVANGLSSGLLIDGDSFGARNSTELSITSLTRSGSTATLVATSLAPVLGSTIRIGNVTNDPRWNGNYTVLTTNGSNTVTFACASDLSTPATTTRSQIVVNALNQKRADGDVVWAEMLNGVNYALIANVSVGGRTLAEILADFDTIGPGLYSGCLIDLNGGTNDPKNGIATTTSSAALEAYIQKAIGRGHQVLLNTVPALAGAANTADCKVKTLALNAEIRRLAQKYSMPMYDKYAALIDPATADIRSGNFDPSDNIHIAPTGARINGIAKAPIYAKHVPSRPVALPGTTSDTVSVITGSANILLGFFAGTGGTGGAGSIATNWTLAPTTLTVTGSKGTGAVGATQIFTLSGSSGSFTFTGPSVHASAVAGGSYEFVGRLSTANFAAGLRVTVALSATVDSQFGEARALSVASATQPLPTGALSLILRSEPIIIPASSSVSVMRVTLTVATTGAPGGTETITLENWAINRVA
jgi:hypothetical protein